MSNKRNATAFARVILDNFELLHYYEYLYGQSMLWEVIVEAYEEENKKTIEDWC